ncbi:MAG: FG-GAP-like repeat-containing protein [Thermoguttaceae bacterium]|jgi:hypothetical protein
MWTSFLSNVRHSKRHRFHHVTATRRLKIEQLENRVLLFASSINVAIIGDPVVTEGGHLDTTGTDLAGINFTNLAPSNVDASHLAPFDTAVLNVTSTAMNENVNTLTSAAKQALVTFLGTGHKLIIYDSECPTQDYSWLPYPFTTNNAGPTGTFGGELKIIEENTLSTSTSSSPYFIDTSLIVSNTDAVQDANVMTTMDSHWCLDMTAKNYNGVIGPVHTYAEYSSDNVNTGLIIYNGLDQDYTDYLSSNTGAQMIRKIWVQELLQPFNPSHLQCTFRVVGINLTEATNQEVVGASHTVVAKLTCQLGNPVPNTLVSFQVLSGPNAGAEATGTYSPTTLLTDANGKVQFTYTSNGKTGTDLIVARFTNSSGQLITSQQVSVTWSIPGSINIIAVGDDAGGGNLPWVKVYDTNGVLQTKFLAYENTFRGGVRVAVGDVTGDGILDIITVPGAGRAPEVRVFQGSMSTAGQYTATLLTKFNALAATFHGGLNVAVGDVNGDGRQDVVIGEGPGALPQIFVFNGNTLTTTRSLIGSAFNGVENTFRGGVTVAASDLNNDGLAEVIVARGPGGPPTVNVYSYTSKAYVLKKSFNAFATTFTGGVFVAAGDFNGDGTNDIICGAGAGWLPMVNVYSGKNLFNTGSPALLSSFLAYENTFRGGVRVAARAMTGSTSGKTTIWIAPGAGGAARNIRSATYVSSSLAPALVDKVFSGSTLLGAYIG